MRKYLLWSGVIANLLLVVGFLLWARSIYWLGLPLPLYSQKVANDIRVNYPSVAFVTPILDFFAGFEHKNFLYRPLDPTKWHGAGADPDFQPPAATATVTVSNIIELKKALREALPGQQIDVLPGRYEFDRTMEIRQSGAEHNPIRLTGRKLHQVEFSMKGEGLLILQPYWQIENISFIGDCDLHDRCQHALHVVGRASNIVIQNNVFRDFNSALKVNGSKGNYPDFGLVKNNTFYNTSPRVTKGPATPVDIVAVNDWLVSGNFIFDIQKSAGDEVSYAGFIKGNAHRGVFERNLVMCEANLKGGGHTSLGLSFGGGGTGKQYSRDEVSRESTKGVMRNNIIMHCPNDVGIYLNEAHDTLLENNIVYNTVGVDIRYEDSTAVLRNNIISGRVINRAGGSHELQQNLIQSRSFFTGRDHLKDLFKSADLGDFSYIEPFDIQPEAIHSGNGTMADYCGKLVQAPYIGAFADPEFCAPKTE